MKIKISQELFMFIKHWDIDDRQIAAKAVYYETYKYFTKKTKEVLSVENEDILQTAILSVLEEYQKKQSEMLSKNVVYVVRRELYCRFTGNKLAKQKHKLNSTHIEFNDFDMNNDIFNPCTSLQVEYENTIEALKKNLSSSALTYYEAAYEKNLNNKEIQKKLGLNKDKIYILNKEIKNAFKQFLSK